MRFFALSFLERCRFHLMAMMALIGMSGLIVFNMAILEKNVCAEDAGKIRATSGFDGHLSGVANNTGVAGSDWHTDAFLHYNANPGDEPMVVQLTYAKKGRVPPENSVLVTIQAGETVSLRDVLGTAFGGARGPGVIHYGVLQGDVGRLTVNGIVYNRVNERERYGAFVPGRSWATASAPGVSIILPGPVDMTSYRANLAYTVLQDPRDDAHLCENVRIVAHDSSGDVHYNELHSVVPGSWNQLVNAIEQTNLDGESRGVYWELIGQDGCLVDGAVSLVNNPVSDGANIIGRTTLDTDENVWLTGAAYLGGALGTNWRSNLETINPRTEGGGGTLYWFPRGADNSGVLGTQDLTLSAAQGTVFENIVGDFMALEDGSAGAFRVNSLPGAFPISFMQTLNEVGVDDEGRTIAYGLNIPAVSWGDGAQGDLEGVITGIDHNDDNRANLLLQNTLYDPMRGEFLPYTVGVELWLADGTRAVTRMIELKSGEYFQKNGFVDKWLGPGTNVSGATVIVRGQPRPWGSTGGVNAFVSVANGNRIDGFGSGDAHLISQNLTEKPNNVPNAIGIFEHGRRGCVGDIDRFCPECYSQGLANVCYYVQDWCDTPRYFDDIWPLGPNPYEPSSWAFDFYSRDPDLDEITYELADVCYVNREGTVSAWCSGPICTEAENQVCVDDLSEYIDIDFDPLTGRLQIDPGEENIGKEIYIVINPRDGYVSGAWECGISVELMFDILPTSYPPRLFGWDTGSSGAPDGEVDIPCLAPPMEVCEIDEPITLSEGQSMDLWMVSSDPDTESLAFTSFQCLGGCPEWLEFDESTGDIKVTWTESVAGESKLISVDARDGNFISSNIILTTVEFTN